jgi:hypothetical protein
VQLYWVLKHGTFLAQRWKMKSGVNLCYCADAGRSFLVEVGYDASQHAAMALRSFVSTMPLEAYAHWVRLPEG